MSIEREGDEQAKNFNESSCGMKEKKSEKNISFLYTIYEGVCIQRCSQTNWNRKHIIILCEKTGCKNKRKKEYVLWMIDGTPPKQWYIS